jgi:homoserine trans-succinylase
VLPSASNYYWRDHQEEPERLRKELFAALVMSNWVEYPTYGYQKMARHLQKKKHT